jgi:hypothetical protein
MKIRALVLLSVVASLIFGAVFTTRRTLAVEQVKQRSIGRLGIERNEPFRIRSVRIKNKPVQKNKKFDADEDWLGDLTIRVRNTSLKRVVFASIDLFFRSPEGKITAVDQIDYGNRALLTQAPGANEVQSNINPQQEIDVRLNGVGRHRIESMLTDMGYLGAKDIDLRIGRVIFADDTMWYAGSFYRRDSSDSGNWIQAEAPIALKTPGGIDRLHHNVPLSDSLHGGVGAALPARSTTENSFFSFNSVVDLKTLLLPASHRLAPVQSTACYKIVNPQNVWCHMDPGCKVRKDYTDMTVGQYRIESVVTSCTSTLGSYCGLDSTTMGIMCVFPGSGGGGGGGGDGGSGCWSNWDCFAGEYCDGGSGTCYENGSGPAGLQGE